MKWITLTPNAFLSLLISCSILFNSVVPAFAQTRKPTPPSNIATRNDARSTTATPQYDLYQRITEKMRQEYMGSLTETQSKRIEEIRGIFKPSPLNKEPIKTDFEQFQSMYQQEIFHAYGYQVKTLKQQVKDQEKEIDAKAKEARLEELKTFDNYLDDEDDALHLEIKNLKKNTTSSLTSSLEDIADQFQTRQQIGSLLEHEKTLTQWQEDSKASLQNWYNQQIEILDQWRDNLLKGEKETFQRDYEPKLLKFKEEAIQQAVNDLWVYQRTSPMARDLLLEIAPIILPMRTQKKSFFNKEQLSWLEKQYFSLVKKGPSCGENLSSVNCEKVFIAVTGLSMLTNTEEAATDIQTLIQAKYNTPYAVLALMTGVTALLSMKKYDRLDLLFNVATEKEHDLSETDWLSFTTLVDALANKNGQYLGEISKWGAYPIEEKPTSDGPQANVWEDIAQLLADEGTAPALDLVRKYGVEKCQVSYELTTSLKRNYFMRCGGILPFLVGALASGKSGAEKYHLSSYLTQAGAVIMSANGSITTVSQGQAERYRRDLQNTEKNFYDYANKANLTPAALIARHLFLQSMGDLNAESELRIDGLLYDRVYRPSLKVKKPQPGFAIYPYNRNSPAFHAKQVRQDRTGVFRKVAIVGDIAFLVWCVVDVMKLLAKGSRLLTSGFRFLQDLRKVSRLAKNGATVFQRAKMVSRLNIPAKLDKIYGINIKFVNKMQPVVLSQVPQFAPLPFKLPDYTIKTGEILAQGLTFDREAGQLTLTGKKALRAQGLSPKMIYDADNALKRASLNANTAFAEAKISPSKLFGNKNRLYKKTLATEVSTELAKVVGQSEVMPLALRTRDLAIKTPFIEIERIREASQAAKEALAPEQKARIKKQIFWLSVATGLSLSSASSGLINPLQDTFGTQITETDKIWITLALPYVASFGSAFITPFVKKWGTLNILKSSFGFSMAGLATAGLAGYYGKVDTNNLPPLWPLFVSGAAIGISAALSRATLNGLIKTLDPSGASLLGSMLWKNIGSVALVAPAVLFNMGYNIHKNIKGEKIQKTDGSDFSLAFPVLAGLSGAMWFKVSRLKIDKEIGKVAGFMPFNKIDWKAPLSWPKMFAKNTWSFLSNTGKDGMYALKLMGTKEVLPLVLATTAFTGFESAVFNKAGNQLLKPKIQNSLDNGEGSSNIFTADNNLKNTAAFLATAGIAVFPALARKSSGKLVAGMRSLKEGTEYRRMLGLSYALNISGATLLSMNGLDSWTGWLGLSMLGLGTANVTQSFQNLANARVVKSAPVMKELSGLNATARKDVIKAANTSMTTAFSTSQIGLALVPWFVGNRTDTLENKGIIERKDGPLSTLWIPATSIGISLGLATPALLGKWKFKLPPVGTVAASKGIFGSYPAAFKNVRGYLQDWGLISKPIENSLTFPAGFSPLPAIEQTPTVTNPPDIQVNTQKPAEDMPQQ